jgi:RNA polymerase sigma-70 factor (ECF subfamily)
MAFTEIDEKLLVRAYQAGDERAFDTIVRTQYNALYAHALRRLSQHEAAEDAVQDTMLRAYRALPNLDGDLALRAWLHRILTNVCHDEGNRRRRQQGLVEKVAALPEELASDPVDEAVLHDTVRVMSEALNDLPESYREALVLRYVDGLSFREVAEATGISEENARARVQRGKSALHKIMSRISVMLAFIIPGLKRTQAASTSASDSAVSVSDHAAQTVNLTTQLTSHVMSAAPTMSRLAETASGIPSGAKGALAAAAVTAVAAVAAPVAYHQATDSNKTERPTASVAAPSDTHDADAPLKVAGGRTVTTSTTAPVASTSTSVTVPRAEDPFGPEVAVSGGLDPKAPASSTSTSTSTTSTTSTTVPEGPLLEGKLAGDTLTVTGQAPNWDVQGPVSLTVNGRTTSGTVTGRVYVYDDQTAEATIQVTLGGRPLQLRYKGRVVEVTGSGSTTTYKVSAKYQFAGASEFGLADRGDVTLLFRTGSSLAFDLRGRAGS